MGIVKEEKLSLTTDVIKEVYKHVDKLTDSKYKMPLALIKSKHKTYEPEDFVQDVVKLTLDAMNNKVFTSFPKLRSFINCIMEFHYLKEKRKYLYTHRGLAVVNSFDDPVAESLTIGDTVGGDTINAVTQGNWVYNNSNLYDLHNVLRQDLYVVFDWKTAEVCKLHDLKAHKAGQVLSVNYLIQVQKDCGIDEACRQFKAAGFYMTKKVFEQISESIITYMKNHDLIVMNEEYDKVELRRTFREELVALG